MISSVDIPGVSSLNISAISATVLFPSTNAMSRAISSLIPMLRVRDGKGSWRSTVLRLSSVPRFCRCMARVPESDMVRAAEARPGPASPGSVPCRLSSFLADVR